MKILIVTQRFWPENFRINDIATSLVKENNEVTVLTGLPNYPDGIIRADYRSGNNRLENYNGVSVIRAREIARHHNILFRLLNYYSFPYFASKIVKTLPSDFNVVLVNELSPIMAALPAVLYKKMHGAKIVMYEMDLWPHSLLAGGIRTTSPIYKHYSKVSGKIYSSCDKIFVSTKEHVDAIKDLPWCSSVNIEYLPQYAEDQFAKILPIRKNDSRIHVLFAGNIGKAQSVKTIIEAAAILKSKKEIVFDIVGGGSELENNMLLAKKYSLENVVFHGSHPISDMSGYYEMADIMLVTLESQPYAKMTIPGKVQTYMAAGKPIISSADGATARLIEESHSGFAVPAENPAALAKAIIQMDEKTRVKASQASRSYYEHHFKKDQFMKRLTSALNDFAK